MSQLEDLLQQCTVKLALPGRLGWGTGFFVAPRWILTCAHVVQEARDESVQVRWQKQENWAQATVERLLADPIDLALLKVTGSIEANPPCVYFDEEIRSRDPLYLFSYPDQDFPNGCPVTFNCEGLTGDESALIKFASGQVRPGMSGSPLLNQRTGKVCGMVKFTRDRSFDLGGGAIPTQVILEQFPELRSLQQAFHGSDKRWVDLITLQTGIDFQSYRKSVISYYSQQRHLYTPTDVLLPLEARSVRWQTQDNRHEQQPQETVEQFPVLNGLRKYALGQHREHVLLAGRPGSGKSTTLRQLAVSLAKEGQVPVLVELKGNRLVLELIQAEFRRMKQPVTLEQIDEWLLAERLVLLLDGVNEIPNDPLRRSLIQFRQDNSTVPMIFTTRDLSLGGDLGIGKRLEMQPLSEQQMREFVGKYLPEQGDRLLGQLSDRLRELAETPLLLKMLCDMSQQMGTIPQGKGELFRRFDAEYEGFKGLPAVSEEFRRFKPEILQRLAWVMMQGDREKPTEPWLTFHRTQAEVAIEQWLTNRVNDPASKAKEWLEDLLEHHLLQVAADPRQIEFHHQLFQEYYAAEYLLRLLPNLTDEQLKRDYLNFLKWTEPVNLILSMLEEDSQLAKRLQDLVWNLDWNLWSNLRCKSNSRSEKSEEDDVQSLLDSLNSGGFLKDRAVAAAEKLKAFARKPSKPSAAATENLGLNAGDSVPKSKSSNFHVVVKGLIDLIQNVENSTYQGRKKAIQLLVEFGSEECIPTLLKVLDEDPDASVRAEAAEALGKLGCEECVPSLLKILNDSDGDFWSGITFLRGNASEALVRHGSKVAIQGLIDAISHSDPDIRRCVAWQMRSLDSEIAIPVLLKAIKDVDSNVRIAVVESFGCLDSEVAIQSILKATKDPDMWVRVTAIREISKYSSEVGIQSIREALNDLEPNVRCAAVKALIRTDSKIIASELIKAIKDPEQEVRFEAAKALVEYGFEMAIPELLQAIKNSSPWAPPRDAIEALGRMNSEAAILGLIGLFDPPEFNDGLVSEDFVGSGSGGMIMPRGDTLHVIVASVLRNVNFDSEASAFALIDAIDHTNPRVREEISDLLEKITFKGAVPKLEQLIHHSNPNIRKGVIKALGNIGSEETGRKLLETIEDPLPEIRSTTVKALVGLGFKSAIPNLLRVLEDVDFHVCANAIEGLGTLGAEDAVSVLAMIINEPDREYEHNHREESSYSFYFFEYGSNSIIRVKAIEALGRIASKDAIEVLFKAIGHEDRGIREAAAKAFGKINPEITIQYLPRLQEKSQPLSHKSGFWEAQKARAAIQANCRFYSYEIFQAYLAAQEADSQTYLNSNPNAITTQTLESLTIMTDKAPIFNQQHATIGVNYAAEGSKVEFTQHTNPSGQTFEILLTDYQQFIQQLQQKYPTLADPTTVPQIIEVEAKLIEAQDQQRWQNFINLKRLWNGSKKAGIRVGEHFAENNVWTKGAIAFLEGVSEDGK